MRSLHVLPYVCLGFFLGSPISPKYMHICGIGECCTKLTVVVNVSVNGCLSKMLPCDELATLDSWDRPQHPQLQRGWRWMDGLMHNLELPLTVDCGSAKPASSGFKNFRSNREKKIKKSLHISRIDDSAQAWCHWNQMIPFHWNSQ